MFTGRCCWAASTECCRGRARCARRPRPIRNARSGHGHDPRPPVSVGQGGTGRCRSCRPTRGCPSTISSSTNRWTGSARDVIFGTSANVSKLVTGRVTPSHNEMQRRRPPPPSSAAGWSMVFIRSRRRAQREPATRCIYRVSTSLLLFHRMVLHGRACGDGALSADRWPRTRCAANHGLASCGRRGLPAVSASSTPVLVLVEVST